MTAPNPTQIDVLNRVSPAKPVLLPWQGLAQAYRSWLGGAWRGWSVAIAHWIHQGLGACLVAGLALWLLGCGRAETPSGQSQPKTAARIASGTSPVLGVVYYREVITNVPSVIQVAKIDLSRQDLTLHTTLAWGRIAGLATLSDQVALLPPDWGRPVAALNGDFYVVDPQNPYVGDPRGLQILDGELVSAPTDQDSFWMDREGRPQMGHVQSRFEVRWPDGSTSPFGLNEERLPGGVVLYTPRMGISTRTPPTGLEFVLERSGAGPWLPLQVAQQYTARVSELRRSGDTPLVGDIMVLSVGPEVLAGQPAIASVQVGSVLRLSTATEPDLRGVRMAISGGSVLVRHGRRVPLEVPRTLDYRFRSALERHPRSAIGANDQALFLVQVDGRQPRLSMGMTLSELSDYMLKLGCTAALNLDGGASSTFWLEGQVLNSPCHGREREIANGLVVIQKTPAQAQAEAGRAPGGD